MRSAPAQVPGAPRAQLGDAGDAPAAAAVYAIRAARLAKWQVGIITGLVAAHLVTQYISISTGREFLMGIIPAFYLSSEGNLSSYFQALTLLACGLIMLQLHRIDHRPPARAWLVLGFTFLYLSIDEAAGLHEISSWLTMKILGLGFVAYAWVLPIGLATAVLGTVVARDLLTLPRHVLAPMALAGLLFIAGAVVIEILAWGTTEIDDIENVGHPPTLFHAFLVALEEGLEMVGAALFLQVLLRYAARLRNARAILSFQR